MQKSNILNNCNFEVVLREFVDDLIDSCLLDGILIMHRAIKLGYFHIIAPNLKTDEDVSENQTNNLYSSGRDQSSKAPNCCRCGKCNCKVAATRYAVHLSNCMGLGRNSSRRANKRIAEQQRLEDDDTESEEGFYEVPPSTDRLGPKVMASSADQFECRYANGTISQHPSPLKLTISLVPVATTAKSDSGSASNRHGKYTTAESSSTMMNDSDYQMRHS